MSTNPAFTAPPTENHPAGPAGHLRHGRVDALDRHRDGAVGPRAAAATPSTPVAGAFVLHVVEPHLNGPGGDMTAVYAPPRGRPRPSWSVRAPPPRERRRSTTVPRGSTWCPDRVPSRPPSRAPSTPGSCSSRSAAPGSSPTCSPPPSATPVTATPSHPGGRHDRDGPGPVPGALAVLRRAVAAGGSVPVPGTMVRNEAWAAVLERLVQAGSGVDGDDGDARVARIEAARTEWAEGSVAEAVDRFVRDPHRHASGTDHAGVIRASDMAAFRATTETRDDRGVPRAHHRQDRTVGSGPGAPADPPPARTARRRAARPLDGPRRAHDRRGAEARARRTARRTTATATSRWTSCCPTPTPPSGGRSSATAPRTSSARGRSRCPAGRCRRSASRTRPAADRSPASGSPRSREHAVEAVAAPAGTHPSTRTAGEPIVMETGETRGDTCHIDVVDRWGNIVSATPSGGWLQSSPTIPELGFCLGTRLQMTWLEEGTATTLTPGARPRTTLTPTLVLRGRRTGRGDGVTGRRPAGPVAAALPAAHDRRRVVPAAGDRRPALHTTSFPGSFCPAPGPPAASSSRTDWATTSSPGSRSSATSSPAPATGRSAACRA